MKASRRGITLIEIVIVLSLASLVLMMAATTLVAVLRIGKQVNDDLAQDVSITRLASQWREDVHAAINSEMAADCILTMPDQGRIRYRFASPAVTREVFRGDSLIHRDAFVLPSRASVSFGQASEHQGRLHRLEISRANLPGKAFAVPVRPIVFEAAIRLHGAPLAQEAAP
jgi:hypothetical protein